MVCLLPPLLRRAMIYTVKTDALEMRYIKFGRGNKNLVIIPGLNVGSVLDMEEAIVSAYSGFSAEYTVYLFDPRLDLPEKYTVSDLADDTAGAIAALGIEKTCLFGVSVGGMAAMCIAVKYPSLISKLVLGSTVPQIGCDMLGLDGLTGADKVRGFFELLYSDEFIKNLGIADALMSKTVTAEDIRRFEILSHIADGFDITDRLNEIKCPALVIGASNDGILSPSGSAEIAERIGCELYMYGRPYGHAVYDEAPDYKERVLEFLNRE